MKKLLLVVALFCLMTACKSKKKDETKPADTTTTTTTTTESTTTTASVKFADPEVQKFADDYTAFVMAYKNGIMDPAKAQELVKNAQDWSTRMIPVFQRLANNPEEAQKWSEWAANLAKEMMPPTNK